MTGARSFTIESGRTWDVSVSLEQGDLVFEVPGDDSAYHERVDPDTICEDASGYYPGAPYPRS